MMPVDSTDDLYGLPLDEFIPQRTALVKQLRSNGQRDEAAEVAKLTKPSVAAWAVNQLVRTQTKTLRALFKAGDDMAEAATFGKGSAEAMRDATRRLREALARLNDAAHGLLSSDGQPLGSQTLDRVTETLRAAALDPEARADVEGGSLARELQYAGLGIASAAAPAPSPARTEKAEAEPQRTDEAEQRRADAHRAREAGRQRRLEAARREAQLGLTTAQEAAELAEQEQAEAEAERGKAAAALERADERLAAADATVARAAAGLQEAERRLSDLQET